MILKTLLAKFHMQFIIMKQFENSYIAQNKIGNQKITFSRFEWMMNPILPEGMS